MSGGRTGALRALALLATAAPAALSAQSAGDRPVEIRFAAEVGGRPFACGTRYDGVGRRSSTIVPTEFRFFVSGVRLVDAAGGEVPVALEQDGLWQNGGVALLDFEDGSGSCSNGNEPVRHHVAGSVPEGDYVGLRFDVGVPFELNHRDLATQASPLSLTRMFWAWNSGYKFMRIDLRVAESGWMIHLGSTECQPGGSPQTEPTSCAHGNRPAVGFDRFDPDHDVVVFDLAALLDGADVESNQEGTALGCMSSQADPDCAPLFANLGLAHGNAVPGTQRAFRVGSTATQDRAARR